MGYVQIGSGAGSLSVVFDDETLGTFLERLTNAIADGRTGIWLPTEALDVGDGEGGEATGEGLIWAPLSIPIKILFDGAPPNGNLVLATGPID